MNIHKNIFSDAVVVITINIMIIPSTKKDMFWARLFVPWFAELKKKRKKSDFTRGLS